MVQDVGGPVGGLSRSRLSTGRGMTVGLGQVRAELTLVVVVGVALT